MAQQFPSIGSLLSAAWQKTNGSKGAFIGAFAIAIVVALAISIGQNLITGKEFGVLNLPFFILNLISSAVLMAGLFDMGIARAAGQNVSATMVLKHCNLWQRLSLTYLLQSVLTVVGFILFIIPGIYLSIAYIFAIPAAVREGGGVWESLERSRIRVTKNWFSVFFCLLAVSIIVAISTIPLGIGLIWTIPWANIVIGELYLALFGQSDSVE